MEAEAPTYEQLLEICAAMTEELNRLSNLSDEARSLIDLLGTVGKDGVQIVNLKCEDGDVTTLIVERLWTIHSILSGHECPPMPTAITGTLH